MFHVPSHVQQCTMNLPAPGLMGQRSDQEQQQIDEQAACVDITTDIPNRKFNTTWDFLMSVFLTNVVFKHWGGIGRASQVGLLENQSISINACAPNNPQRTPMSGIRNPGTNSKHALHCRYLSASFIHDKSHISETLYLRDACWLQHHPFIEVQTNDCKSFPGSLSPQ